MTKPKAPLFPPDSAPAEEWERSSKLVVGLAEEDAQAFIDSLHGRTPTVDEVGTSIVHAYRARGVPSIWIAASCGWAAGAGRLSDAVYIAVMEALEAETRPGN